MIFYLNSGQTSGVPSTSNKPTTIKDLHKQIFDAGGKFKVKEKKPEGNNQFFKILYIFGFVCLDFTPVKCHIFFQVDMKGEFSLLMHDQFDLHFIIAHFRLICNFLFTFCMMFHNF